MHLVILGSGTCVPTGRRVSSGYWVQHGPLRLRLDCGAGTVHAMGRNRLPWQSLTHQFISHFHIDHAGELPALLFALKWGRTQKRSERLELIGPAGLGELVRALDRLYRADLLAQEFPLDIVELAPGGGHDLGFGARLRVHKTPHNDESLAVRIDADGRSLGYTGDTAASDELGDFFYDVDLLIAECAFIDDVRGTRHLDVAGVSALAERARCRHLVATHAYFDAEAERLGDRLTARLDCRVTVALDGMNLEV
jgi:ribonuclease BN (tRNA processing enzyme)